MRRKNDDNSVTQRSIGHDIREFPRGRDDEKERDRDDEKERDRGDDDDDPFERGFRVDFDGGAAAENSIEWEEKKFRQEGGERPRPRPRRRQGPGPPRVAGSRPSLRS